MFLDRSQPHSIRCQPVQNTGTPIPDKGCHRPSHGEEEKKERKDKEEEEGGEGEEQNYTPPEVLVRTLPQLSNQP